VYRFVNNEQKKEIQESENRGRHH